MGGEGIPFNRACLAGREREYLAEAMAGGMLGGDGAFTRRCHELLERELGASRVLLTTSCTHALEMAALLLEVKPGDEVLLPAFTFVSTVNAFVLRGARPVFVDIRRDTLNLDQAQIEARLGPNSRAIVPVHYAGVACEMDAILALAAARGVAVVEDNAHGLFGRYHGRYLGTFGALAAQSFHTTKNFTCGEGGALVINRPDLVERAEIVREKGTNRSRFFRGQVDRYTWVDVGSSYLPSEMLAAFLLAQLEAREEIQTKRRRIWEYYAAHLGDWAERLDCRLPVVPKGCEPAFHLFHLILPSEKLRDGLMAHLKERGIASTFHYLPLHLSEYGRRLGGRPGDLPVTEDLAGRLLRLPFYNDLSASDLERVVSAVREFAP